MRRIGNGKHTESAAKLQRKIAVVTAWIVVLCCAAFFVFAFPLLFHSAPQPPPAVLVSQPFPPSTAPSASLPPEQTPSTAETPASETEATIFLTGDLMCLGGQQSAAKTTEGYDFHKSFSMISELFAAADYVAGNLETTINDAAPFTAPSRSAQTGPDGAVAPREMPVLNAPETYLDALRDAGYDFVSTVNNHCCDTGAEGIKKTLTALDDRGIAHTGTFFSNADQRFWIADIRGIRVAFVAYSEFFNGKDALLPREERDAMVSAFSAESARRDVRDAREAGAEFVIVYQHWGDENQPLPNDTQKEHAQILADAGADVIAGSHPHCLQPAEYIRAADGRRVLCLYSLGNFVSSMAQEMHNDTAVVKLRLVKTPDGRVSLAEAGYFPCRVFSSYRGDPFVVVPAPEDSQDESLRAARERIAGRMGTLLSPAG